MTFLMLLDTSGLLSYVSAREAGHETAVSLFDQASRTVTHNYVLAELVALAQARKLPRLPILTFISRLLQHPKVEIVWANEVLHRQATDLLSERLDKEYSLCDAVSFVLIRKLSINEAFTTDHHFEQEGFIKLL